MDDRVVTTSSLFLGIPKFGNYSFASIRNVATLPEAQRKGYATVLMNTILQTAKDLNINFVVLQASKLLMKNLTDIYFYSASFYSIV